MVNNSIMFVFRFHVVFFLFLTTACREDALQGEGESGDDARRVMVELRFKIPPIESPKASPLRAAQQGVFTTELFHNDAPKVQMRSDGTTKLFNLWAFQFNADGTINGAPQKITDEITVVNDMAFLDVELKVATNQTIYLVMLGKQVMAEMATVTKMKELESLSMDYLQLDSGLYKSRIVGESEIPLAGNVKGVSIVPSYDGTHGVVVYNTPEGFGGGIEIKRLVSRIRLKHKFDIPANQLEGARLQNVPATVCIDPTAIPSDAMKYVEVDAPLLLTDMPDEDGYYTSVWYVAPNMKGNVMSIATEDARCRKVEADKVYGAAPEFGTNIELWSYAKNSRDNYTVHQIYIGKNNTYNFDVEANNYYNLRTTVNSFDTNDGRIRNYKTSQNTFLSSVGKIGPTVKDEPTNVYFDVHYDQRPIIVYARGRHVDVGIFTDANCTTPADMNVKEKNWLQLSSYPNYTEVMQNRHNSMSNRIAADIILPTRLKFYLYCDEFVYNDDGSLSTDAVTSYNDLKERTLYVKITTTQLGVINGDKLEAKYTIKQRQGLYCGLFGGELYNGQYDRAIVMDNVDEYVIRYDDIYPLKMNTYYNGTPMFGYDAQNAYNITSGNAYSLLYNGKYNTRNLAENPADFLVAKNLTDIFEMKKNNGVIDLYQYDYYRTYSARYCYDRNRDKNGNGKIDYDPIDSQKNELEWYLPSPYQAIAIKQGFGKRALTFLNSSSTYCHLMAVALGIGTASGFTMDDRAFGAGSGVFNSQKTAQQKMPRCIRDVPIDPGKKIATQVSAITHNSESYVMIDLSDMPDGVADRTKNLEKLYEQVELYTYSTTGQLTPPSGGGNDYSKPSVDAAGKVIVLNRIRRHAVGYFRSAVYPDSLREMMFIASRKFIISPIDVYSDGGRASNNSSVLLNGQRNTLTMSWAVANGRLVTANTSSWEIPTKATATGCYAYQGKSGKDEMGTWRTPTFQELSMIMLFAREMEGIAPATGFEKLLRHTTDDTANIRYWSASHGEIASNGSSAGLSFSGIPFGSANGGGKTIPYYLRCIKDIS